MRFMITRKADKDTEAGVMPSEQLLAELMRDFGAEFTPDLRANEERLRAAIEQRPAGAKK